MIVKNAMTRKVYMLSPDEGFTEIVKFLAKKKISGAPVVNNRQKVVGFVSEKDLLLKLFPSRDEFFQDPDFFMNFKNVEKNAGDVYKLRAKDIMSTNLVTVAPEDNILKACSYMLTKNVRQLPVIKEGKLVGIVTTNNIYQRYLSHFLKFTGK